MMLKFIKQKIKKYYSSYRFYYRLQDEIKLILKYFFNRRTLTSTGTVFEKQPFFIIGSGRSGSTLLRELLNQHSDVIIPPESFVIGECVRKFLRYSYLPRRELTNLILGEFTHHHNFPTWNIDPATIKKEIKSLPQKNYSLVNIIEYVFHTYRKTYKPDATTWGDKSPINTLRLPWVDLPWDNAKYINLVRDGRDVCRSYLEMGKYNTIEEALNRWKKSVNEAQKLKDYKTRTTFITLRYEDLVTNPGEELKKLCSFLELEFEKSMTSHHETAPLGDDVNTHEHLRNVQKPITSDSVGKWKSYFSEQKKEKLNKKIGATLESLNYPIS